MHLSIFQQCQTPAGDLESCLIVAWTCFLLHVYLNSSLNRFDFDLSAMSFWIHSSLDRGYITH